MADRPPGAHWGVCPGQLAAWQPWANSLDSVTPPGSSLAVSPFLPTLKKQGKPGTCMFHDWWWFVYTMSISLSFFVCVRDGGMDPTSCWGTVTKGLAIIVLFCFLRICARRYLGENYRPSLSRHESGLLHMRLTDHPYLKG